MVRQRGQRKAWRLAAALVAAAGVPVLADPPPDIVREPTAPEYAPKPVAPDDPAMAQWREFRKKQLAVEKDLKKIRAQYFRNINNSQRRLEGIAKLKAQAQPEHYQLLIEVFGGEKPDVRSALLSIFRENKADAGDRGLAWLAVTDPDSLIRDAALEHIAARAKEAKEVPPGVYAVATGALRAGTPLQQVNASVLAQQLSLYELIPLLLQAQFGGGPQASAGGNQPRGDLAYVFIGRQTTFVSDLTPLVAENSVAFDPTLGVISTGALLRVHDATVTGGASGGGIASAAGAAPAPVGLALQDLGTRLTGAPTPGLAMSDRESWRQWYDVAYVPAMKSLAAKRALEHDAAKKGAASHPGLLEDAARPR